jgi:hypothetical protein
MTILDALIGLIARGARSNLLVQFREQPPASVQQIVGLFERVLFPTAIHRPAPRKNCDKLSGNLRAQRPK